MQPPLSYRWLRANRILHLIPWHFIDEEEGRLASERFRVEHPEGWILYTFARREDCDDFAGFRVIDGNVTEQVVYFHPSFAKGFNEHIVSNSYPDLWAFFREVVIPDSATWYTDFDVQDLEQKNTQSSD